MNIKIIIFPIILFVVIIFGAIFLKEQMKQEVVFKNLSGQDISILSIGYIDRKITFNNLKNEEYLKHLFNNKIDQEGGFNIEITFSNGVYLEAKNIGYITKADKSDFVIIIDKQKNVFLK